MSTHEPAVRITLAEIYREVQELRDIVRPMACDVADLRERFELVEANAVPWKWLAKAAGAIGLSPASSEPCTAYSPNSLYALPRGPGIFGRATRAAPFR